MTTLLNERKEWTSEGRPFTRMVGVFEVVFDPAHVVCSMTDAPRINVFARSQLDTTLGSQVNIVTFSPP